MSGIGSLAGLGALAALDVVNLTSSNNRNAQGPSEALAPVNPSSRVTIGGGDLGPSIVGTSGVGAYAAMSKIAGFISGPNAQLAISGDDITAQSGLPKDYVKGYVAGFQSALELVRNLADDDIVDTLLEALKKEQEECRKK